MPKSKRNKIGAHDLDTHLRINHVQHNLQSHLLTLFRSGAHEGDEENEGMEGRLAEPSTRTNRRVSVYH
jgi:hypothetical protein